MKIYFDFDRTLFDTKVFLEDLYEILEEYHIPLDLFEEIRIKDKENGFDCFRILEKLKKEHPFNTAIYTDLERFLECDKMYLFNDCVELLKYLRERHYQLIMLTRGDRDFQQVKIDYTDIDQYFDDIIITNKHKGELDIDYNAIFIDDNLEEIESILKNNPKRVIYINRYSKEKLKDPRFLSINSLKELYKIISD